MRSNAKAVFRPRERGAAPQRGRQVTFTGAIGALCMWPLRGIIAACVALRIHPNTLTLIGVLINAGAAWALASRRFILGGVVMVVANIFDFIDGKVAHRLQLQSRFGAFTNRMAGVLWVILLLSILAVANRIYYTFLVLNGRPMPSRHGVRGFFNRAFFWTDERATVPYDLWVVAILAFVWLIPPAWLGDPTAQGPGLLGWIAQVAGGRS